MLRQIRITFLLFITQLTVHNMARYSTFSGVPIRIDATNDFLNTGWSVNNGVAHHYSCNPGFITTNSVLTEPESEYKVTYTVLNRVNGNVYIIVGGSVGTLRSSNGTYTETIIANDASGITLWSDGDLSIRGVRVSSGTVSGKTIAFNDKYRRWVGSRDYIPTLSVKFLDRVMVFQDGEMWEQWTNELRNNFFGQQFGSKIVFYANVNPKQIKNFHSMRVKSNLPWSVPEIKILPRHGKSKGQLSRIKKGNFKSYQGDWFADFLKDINDPRFGGNELNALVEGADLQGGVAEITIENNDISEVRLISVDIEVSPQNYTF